MGEEDVNKVVDDLYFSYHHQNKLANASHRKIYERISPNRSLSESLSRSVEATTHLLLSILSYSVR